MSELEKALDSAQVVEQLRAAHSRALRALAKKEANEEELVEAVYRAARDAAAIMSIPAVPTPKPDKRKAPGETCVVVLSDWQLGATRAGDYSIEIAKKRIDLLAKKVERLIAIQRQDHPVDDIRVYILGDIVESDGNIFPSQAYEVEVGGVYVQIFEAAQMLADFVRRMAAIAPKVRVRNVIGNHGRLGRYGDHSPESNADAIAYRVARDLVRDPRVDWKEAFTPGARHWYETDELPNGEKIFLTHGDQFKGGAFGLPYYAIAKRAQGWNLSVAEFQYLFYGHWHTPARLVLSDGSHTVWGSPSIESGNRYAQEWLAASGRPGQWCVFFGEHGPTAEYLVRLDDKEKKAKA
jgi:hypothetical protein